MAQWNKDAQAYRVQDTTNFEVVMIADEDGNPLNSYGSAANIPIAAGQLAGYSSIEKFGRNPNVTTSIETIWEHGGIYEYLTTASQIFVYSASSDDGVGGVGAIKVTVQGLDENWNIISEELTVNGAGSALTFLRVYRAFITDAGSDGYNNGNLIISTLASGAGTVLADIGGDGTGNNFIGYGQTMLALYTVPAGKTAYVTQWTIGNGNYNTSTSAFLRTRLPFNGFVMTTADTMAVSGGFHVKNYSIPLKFAEKTDIEVQAFNGGGTIMSSTFNVILVDN